MKKDQLFAIFIFSCICILIIIGKFRQKRLQETMKVTNGYIYRTAIGNQGWLNIYYKFTVDNVEYQASKTSELKSKYYSIFANKNFPVIYSSENINLNFMLISPRDFKKYNIEFPDSLLWVKKLAK